MGAALALAGALDIPPRAVAEFLPVIEVEMIRKMNEKIGDRSDG